MENDGHGPKPYFILGIMAAFVCNSCPLKLFFKTWLLIVFLPNICPRTLLKIGFGASISIFPIKT